MAASPKTKEKWQQKQQLQQSEIKFRQWIFRTLSLLTKNTTTWHKHSSPCLRRPHTTAHTYIHAISIHTAKNDGNTHSFNETNTCMQTVINFAQKWQNDKKKRNARHQRKHLPQNSKWNSQQHEQKKQKKKKYKNNENNSTTEIAIFFCYRFEHFYWRSSNPHYGLNGAVKVYSITNTLTNLKLLIESNNKNP